MVGKDDMVIHHIGSEQKEFEVVHILEMIFCNYKWTTMHPHDGSLEQASVSCSNSTDF